MKKSIKLVLIYMLVQLFTGILTGVVSRLFSLTEQPILLSFSLFFSIIITSIILYKLGYFCFKKKNWSFISIRYTLLASLLGILSIVIVDSISPFSRWLPNLMDKTFSILQSGFFGIICIAVIGPIFEEILFRGCITDILLKEYKPIKAIILSSLIFGIFHFNPSQILPAFIIGIILGLLYYKTSSLIPGIIIHILNNSTSVILSILFPKAKYLGDIISCPDYVIIVISAIILFIPTIYVISQYRITKN